MSKGGFTVFIKLRHDGSNYKMCGDQIGFNYNDFNDFIGLIGVVKERLDKILVSYTPGLDDNIIKSNNLYIAKISEKYKDKERLGYENSSVAISAAVTAYVRIHISQIKLDIMNMGGSIYYSDTDSIVTNIELPSNFVSPTELGKLKLEHNIKHGIFIIGKTYCLITDENKFINKAKGIKSKSLNYTDYCLLLNNVYILNIN